MADYLRAVEIECAALNEPRPVKTLYFGGGTPTQLDSKSLHKLLDLAIRWFPPELAERHTEWTVEANPEDATPEKIALLAEQGVTRISLGVQSFDPQKLVVLERSHTAEQVATVLESIRAAGLQVSIDLIFAAPGEQLADWQADIDHALALQPDHLSIYGLTFEKGTSFWSRRLDGRLAEADEDLQRSMYLETIDRLAAAGYQQYEISNYSLPGQRSRHNESYWLGEQYFAAGPGASRFVAGVRETNHRSTTTYLRRVLGGESPVAEREELNSEQLARERLVFGLRRIEGVKLQDFASSTGYTVEQLAGEAIDKYVALGFLERTTGKVCLTREGLLVSDALWPDLL